MLGWKIYYDKKQGKFVGEEDLTEVGEESDLIRWFINYKSMCAAVIRKNKRHKNDISELVKDDDFIIKECQDCGEGFILKKSKISWYNKKGFHLPVRCKKCIVLKKGVRD